MITEETTTLIQKWGKTKLLDGLDEATQHKTAQLLENQRIYHENLPEHAMSHRMKRISIPILRRLVGGLNQAGVEFEVEEEYCSFPEQINTGIKCQSYEPDGRYSRLGLRSAYVLDAEAELCIEIYEKLVSKIRGHIASRRWDNPKCGQFVILGIGQNKEDEVILFCRKK